MRRSVNHATIRAGLLGLLLAGAIYLYLPTIAWLGQVWLGAGPLGGAARDWSHGPLVVLFIGFLLLRRRGELVVRGAPSPRGMPLIAVGIGLHLAGYLSRAPLVNKLLTQRQSRHHLPRHEPPPGVEVMPIMLVSTMSPNRCKLCSQSIHPSRGKKPPFVRVWRRGLRGPLPPAAVSS